MVIDPTPANRPGAAQSLVVAIASFGPSASASSSQSRIAQTPMVSLVAPRRFAL
jgi:hypothetical protein